MYAAAIYGLVLAPPSVSVVLIAFDAFADRRCAFLLVARASYLKKESSGIPLLAGT